MRRPRHTEEERRAIDEVLSTFDEYLNCGVLSHGAARVYCDSCQHTLLVAFSCKKREEARGVPVVHGEACG